MLVQYQYNFLDTNQYLFRSPASTVDSLLSGYIFYITHVYYFTIILLDVKVNYMLRFHLLVNKVTYTTDCTNKWYQLQPFTSYNNQWSNKWINNTKIIFINKRKSWFKISRERYVQVIFQRRKIYRKIQYKSDE